MQEIKDRIIGALRREGLDALVTFGADNFAYVTGIVLPFPQSFPERNAVAIVARDGSRSIVCPLEWRQVVEDQGWDGGLEAYDENDGLPPWSALDALGRALVSLGLGKGTVGLDRQRTTARVAQALAERWSGLAWQSGDDLLRELRQRKSAAEVARIEQAAREADLGIIGALNHMEGSLDGGGYTLSEFSERTRVHAYEEGSTGVGHVAAFTSATGSSAFAPQGPDKFVAGDLARVDITSHSFGYWANLSRMFVLGDPTAAQLAAHGLNLELKALACDMLRPGRRCDDIFREVAARAERARAGLRTELGIGHGVGVSEREGPYLQAGDSTALESGMVVALEVNTDGPRGEIIRSKDIYEIRSDGPRLLSWYRNWDRLYHVFGYRSAH